MTDHRKREIEATLTELSMTLQWLAEETGRTISLMAIPFDDETGFSLCVHTGEGDIEIAHDVIEIKGILDRAMKEE